MELHNFIDPQRKLGLETGHQGIEAPQTVIGLLKLERYGIMTNATKPFETTYSNCRRKVPGQKPSM
jgi:hypothetical protein